ncbi:thioredoxin-like protein, partial [Protomyces lactucae-debilis]
AGHGTYVEIMDEKAVLDVTTSTDRCVVHFFHKDFARCSIMHRHLEQLARKHIETRFLKVDVEQVPFLVTRLEIRVLPCVIPFVKGIGKTRILGFEGLGGDAFRTGTLELVLQRAGVLQGLRGDAALEEGKRSIMGYAEREEEYDSD